MRIKASHTSNDMYKIFTYNPKVFWKTCDGCGDKIKQEEMWQVTVYSQRWGCMQYHVPVFDKFFCKECYPTVEDITKLCEDKC